mgnify:FL=1
MKMESLKLKRIIFVGWISGIIFGLVQFFVYVITGYISSIISSPLLFLGPLGFLALTIITYYFLFKTTFNLVYYLLLVVSCLIFYAIASALAFLLVMNTFSLLL